MDVDREEGEIDSDSPSEKQSESLIDRAKAELSRFRDEIMTKRSRKNQRSRQLLKVHDSAQVSSNADNYEVVSMDIESPTGGDPPDRTEEEDEETLRQLLLDQMKRRKEKSQQRQRNNHVSPAVSNPYTRPPLTPPGNVVLTPPPAPPPDLGDQPPPPPNPSHPSDDTISQPQTSEPTNELVEPYSPKPANVAQRNDLADEESPKSPVDVEEDDWEEQLDLDGSEEEAFSDDLSVFELDLDEAKDDNRARWRELTKLFQQQKQNQHEYNKTKKSVEKLKDEITEQERKLAYHSEKAMKVNERISTLLDRYFTAQSKRLKYVRSERDKWKNKVRKNRELTKQMMKQKLKTALKERIHKPKTIPLEQSDQEPKKNADVTQKPILDITQKPTEIPLEVDHQTNPGPSSQVDIDPSTRRNESALTVNPLSSVPASNWSSPATATSIETSVAQGLDMDEIAPGAKDATDAETQLLHRLMQKKRKQKRVNTSEDLVEDPHPNLAVQSLGQFGQPSEPLAKSLSNPLIHLKSYRLQPTFPFDHISHPAISNKLKPDTPLCPFELHGLCMDEHCKMQHDQDIRVSEEEIIREMLAFHPQLCPSHMQIVDYARHLLQIAHVDVVARYVASSIPAEVRERCFSAELKKFLS